MRRMLNNEHPASCFGKSDVQTAKKPGSHTTSQVNTSDAAQVRYQLARYNRSRSEKQTDSRCSMVFVGMTPCFYNPPLTAKALCSGIDASERLQIISDSLRAYYPLPYENPLKRRILEKKSIDA